MSHSLLTSAVWFYLYEVLEQARLIQTARIQNSGNLRWELGSKLIAKRQEEIFWCEVNVWCLDWRGGHTEYSFVKDYLLILCKKTPACTEVWSQGKIKRVQAISKKSALLELQVEDIKSKGINWERFKNCLYDLETLIVNGIYYIPCIIYHVNLHEPYLLVSILIC